MKRCSAGQLQFITPEASGGTGCVAVAFHTPDASMAGSCVAVGFHGGRKRLECNRVHVRSTNSKHPYRTVKVSARRWKKGVQRALDTGELDFKALFPWWRRGFVRTFTDREIEAFETDVLNRNPLMLGPAFAA